MMDRQVQQHARLIDDLLDVSRITRGKIELRKEPVELAAVVGRGRRDWPGRSSRHAARSWRLAAAPSRSALEADPTRLEQVFGNLLNNAAKFTRTGGRRLGDGRATGERQDEVVVRVRDNGIGIAAGDCCRSVFDLFAQADRLARPRRRGGSGSA